MKQTLAIKRIKTIWNVISSYSGIKLEINKRKISGKFPNSCKLNNSLLKDRWVRKKV